MADYLGLERNVSIASAAIFLLGLGEELWKKFLPKYLESLGASSVVIGLFGTTEDFFDAVYQYPGGWLADRVGRRLAFLVFIGIACVGGLIKHLNSKKKLSLVKLGIDLLTAGFTGVLTFWLCESINIHGSVSAILIATGGLMGNRVWVEFEQFYRTRLFPDTRAKRSKDEAHK